MISVRTPLFALALVAGAAQAADLVSCIQMMVSRGLGAELNPIVRGIFVATGPLGLGAIKLAAVALLVTLIVRIGLGGRTLLAGNVLVFCALMGAVGYWSNVI